jgi:hypothetical protein
MVRISILGLMGGLIGTTALAQNPADLFNKPPAKVDKELRARIDEFYQDHVKQQFRKADSLVAADTKEFFYIQNKPAYLSCEVGRVDYSEKFTRAKATVLCEQYVMLPGFADKPIKVPIPSTWKLEKGKWYWYVDQAALHQTPFGKMTAGAGPPTGGLPAALPDNADFVLNLVKADKETVELKPGMSEKVTITNSAPGNMDLTIVGRIPGVEASLDHAQMKVGDRAVLTLKAGDKPQSGLFSLRIEQTGLVIPIQVVIPQ